MSAFSPEEQEKLAALPFALHAGDCIEMMKSLPDCSVDAVVTDPPYELGFMGKSWDSTGIAYNVEMWREALRVLKPGGHLLAFSGSRTYHRMTCAIEDAGFEIRDQIMWVFGSGFPKSLNVSKAIESGTGRPKDIRRMQMGEDYAPSGRGPANYDYPGQETMNGATAPWVPFTDAGKDWEGWGTALKPAHEPICIARKPLAGTVVANVLAFGTGSLNIDACRVPTGDEENPSIGRRKGAVNHLSDRPASESEADGKLVSRQSPEAYRAERAGEALGRWPANLIHDGSDEVLAAFPDTAGQQGKVTGNEPTANGFSGPVQYGGMLGRVASADPRIDSIKSAARFFYCAKTSRADRNEGLVTGRAPAVATGATMRDREVADWPTRNGNHHPTVKPTDLMAYLVRLVTPAGGVVLDPFMGSGSTGKACMREGMRFIGIEMEPEYLAIAKARIEYEIGAVARRAAELAEQNRMAERQIDLFAVAAEDRENEK